MPSFSNLNPTTISIRAQSQEQLFRRAIAHLRAVTPDNPRAALFAELSRLLPEALTSSHPVLRAQREAIQPAIIHHSANDNTIFDAALTAMDAFLSVRIHGARSKASAFFDRYCRETSWTHIALFAPSTVAEACFLALNESRKRLTVIDVGPEYPGRALAARLAAQTNAPTRYAVLSSAAHALETVDVLLLGAREVCVNGCVICEEGAGALVQIAKDSGVSVVVVTQAVKYSDRMVVDWNAGGDVIRPDEITAVVTELDTATWNTCAAPNILVRSRG